MTKYQRYQGPFPSTELGTDDDACPVPVSASGSSCVRDVLTQTIPSFISGNRETTLQSVYLPPMYDGGPKFPQETLLRESAKLHRFAYDADGTIVILQSENNNGRVSEQELRALNSLDPNGLVSWGPIGGLGSGQGRGGRITFIFPEKRDIAWVSVWCHPGDFVGINLFEGCLDANTKADIFNHAEENPDWPGRWDLSYGVPVPADGWEEYDDEGGVSAPLNKCGQAMVMRAPVNAYGPPNIGYPLTALHNNATNYPKNINYRPSHHQFSLTYPGETGGWNAGGVKAITIHLPYVAGPLSIKNLSHIYLYGHKTAPLMAELYDPELEPGDLGYYWFPHSWEEKDDTLDQVDFCLEDESYRYEDVTFGNVRRNEEATLKEAADHLSEINLYFKNYSPERTATAVNLTADDVHLSSYDHNIVFSLDEEDWDTILRVENLGPGEVVGPVYVKLFAPVDEPVGLKEMRFRLSVEGWDIE